MKINDITKWAWASGLIDGEGTFVKRSKKKGSLEIWCSIKMTDEDVLNRLYTLIGGTFKGPYNNYTKDHYKPYWRWAVYKRDDVINTIEHIYYFLCQRRRNKCDELIKAYEDHTGNKVNLIDYDLILAKLTPSELELVHNAYCAGIFEGEGCLTPYTKDRRSAAIRLNSTDEDIVDRFKSYIKVGNKLGPYKAPRKTKDFYVWDCARQEECLTVINKIKPFLLKRRASKCIEVLDSINAVREEGSKLTPQQVKEIKHKLLNYKEWGIQAKLAKEYSVHPSAISWHYRNLMKHFKDKQT